MDIKNNSFDDNKNLGHTNRYLRYIENTTPNRYIFRQLKSIKLGRILKIILTLIIISMQFRVAISKPTSSLSEINLENTSSQNNSVILKEDNFISIRNEPKQKKDIFASNNPLPKNILSRHKRSSNNPFSMLPFGKNKEDKEKKDGNLLNNIKNDVTSLFTFTEDKKPNKTKKMKNSNESGPKITNNVQTPPKNTVEEKTPLAKAKINSTSENNVNISMQTGVQGNIYKSLSSTDLISATNNSSLNLNNTKSIPTLENDSLSLNKTHLEIPMNNSNRKVEIIQSNNQTNNNNQSNISAEHNGNAKLTSLSKVNESKVGGIVNEQNHLEKSSTNSNNENQSFILNNTSPEVNNNNNTFERNTTSNEIPNSAHNLLNGATGEKLNGAEVEPPKNKNFTAAPPLNISSYGSNTQNGTSLYPNSSSYSPTNIGLHNANTSEEIPPLSMKSGNSSDLKVTKNQSDTSFPPKSLTSDNNQSHGSSIPQNFTDSTLEAKLSTPSASTISSEPKQPNGLNTTGTLSSSASITKNSTISIKTNEDGEKSGVNNQTKDFTKPLVYPNPQIGLINPPKTPSAKAGELASATTGFNESVISVPATNFLDKKPSVNIGSNNNTESVQELKSKPDPQINSINPLIPDKANGEVLPPRVPGFSKSVQDETTPVNLVNSTSEIGGDGTLKKPSSALVSPKNMTNLDSATLAAEPSSGSRNKTINFPSKKLGNSQGNDKNFLVNSTSNKTSSRKIEMASITEQSSNGEVNSTIKPDDFSSPRNTSSIQPTTGDQKRGTVDVITEDSGSKIPGTFPGSATSNDTSSSKFHSTSVADKFGSLKNLSKKPSETVHDSYDGNTNNKTIAENTTLKSGTENQNGFYPNVTNTSNSSRVSGYTGTELAPTPANILFLNQTNSLPKAENQIRNGFDPLKGLLGQNDGSDAGKGPSNKEGDISNIPYTNDVSEEVDEIPYTNDVNSEDKMKDSDDIVVVTESTVSSSTKDSTNKIGNTTTDVTSRISSKTTALPRRTFPPKYEKSTPKSATIDEPPFLITPKKTTTDSNVIDEKPFVINPEKNEAKPKVIDERPFLINPEKNKTKPEVINERPFLINPENDKAKPEVINERPLLINPEKNKAKPELINERPFLINPEKDKAKPEVINEKPLLINPEKNKAKPEVINERPFLINPEKDKAKPEVINERPLLINPEKDEAKPEVIKERPLLIKPEKDKAKPEAINERPFLINPEKNQPKPTVIDEHPFLINPGGNESKPEVKDEHPILIKPKEKPEVIDEQPDLINPENRRPIKPSSASTTTQPLNNKISNTTPDQQKQTTTKEVFESTTQTPTETTVDSTNEEEKKDCENGKTLGGILGSALQYGAIGGSAGAIGAMLPQILNMIKDLLKKDGGDDGNKKDDENKSDGKGNKTEKDNTDDQPENTGDILDQEISEAEDKVMGEIDDKIDNIEGSVVDTIKGKLTDVEDGVFEDLKQQIFQGEGNILQNVKAAVGGENNVFRNIKGRLMEAKDSLVTDVKTSLKSAVENDEDLSKLSKFIHKDSVRMDKVGGNCVNDNFRTNVQMLFINEKARTRRTSWPATRNDYLGKVGATQRLEEEQKTDSPVSKEYSDDAPLEENNLVVKNTRQDVPEIAIKTAKVFGAFKKIMKN